MALGNYRPRNWGKSDQEVALQMTLQRKSVAFEVRRGVLYLAASKNGITLPFTDSCASLVNVRRGKWEARSIQDDRMLATGCSERDLIRGLAGITVFFAKTHVTD